MAHQDTDGAVYEWGAFRAYGRVAEQLRTGGTTLKKDDDPPDGGQPTASAGELANDTPAPHKPTRRKPTASKHARPRARYSRCGCGAILRGRHVNACDIAKRARAETGGLPPSLAKRAGKARPDAARAARFGGIPGNPHKRRSKSALLKDHMSVCASCAPGAFCALATWIATRSEDD